MIGSQHKNVDKFRPLMNFIEWWRRWRHILYGILTKINSMRCTNSTQSISELHTQRGRKNINALYFCCWSHTKNLIISCSQKFMKSPQIWRTSIWMLSPTDFISVLPHCLQYLLTRMLPIPNLMTKKSLPGNEERKEKWHLVICCI